VSDTKVLNNLRDNVTRDLTKSEQRAAELLEERDRARRFAVSLEQENAEMSQTIGRLQTRIAELEGREFNGGEDA
jgi:predicted  nucleic acid-binding Zn-ribbon protein